MLTNYKCLNVTVDKRLNLNKAERLITLGNRISNKSDVKRVKIEVYNADEIDNRMLDLVQNNFNKIFNAPLIINEHIS